MPGSDRRARVSLTRCVSRVRLQRDRQSLRQAFGMLLKNASAQRPVFVLSAPASASFPAPSKVSDKAPAHPRYPLQNHADDPAAAVLRLQRAEYGLSYRDIVDPAIERR